MASKNNKSKLDKVLVDGVVTAVLPDTNYIVRINVGGIDHNVSCYPSGKMRKNYIRLAEGDQVTIEITPQYDIDKGRVVFKKNKREVQPSGNEQPVAATSINE